MMTLIRKKDSQMTRKNLKILYEIESNEALDEWVQAILRIISSAFQTRSGYAKVSFTRLYKAIHPFVFGEPRSHQVSFTDKTGKLDYVNIGIAEKILQVLVGEKNEELEMFISELNCALAEKHNCNTFDIEYLLEENTAEELKSALLSYKKKHKTQSEKKIKKPTQKELLKDALEIIFQTRPDNKITKVRDIPVYFVGEMKEIRSEIKGLTGLDYQQICNALNKLESAGEIIRTGNHFNKKIYFNATSSIPVEIVKKDKDSSRSPYPSTVVKSEKPSKKEHKSTSRDVNADIDILSLLDKSNLSQIEQAANNVRVSIESVRTRIDELQEKQTSLEGKLRILDSIIKELK
jgi:hypothetical protein